MHACNADQGGRSLVQPWRAWRTRPRLPHADMKIISSWGKRGSKAFSQFGKASVALGACATAALPALLVRRLHGRLQPAPVHGVVGAGAAFTSGAERRLDQAAARTWVHRLRVCQAGEQLQVKSTRVLGDLS